MSLFFTLKSIAIINSSKFSNCTKLEYCAKCTEVFVPDLTKAHTLFADTCCNPTDPSVRASECVRGPCLDSPKGSVGTSFPGEVDPCGVAVLCCYPVFQVSVVNKEMLLLLPFCLIFFSHKSLRSLAFGCWFCMLLTRGSMSCLSLVASLALDYFYRLTIYGAHLRKQFGNSYHNYINCHVCCIMGCGGGNSGLENTDFQKVSCMCVTMWKSNCSFLVWVYLACNSWQPALGCVDHSPVDVRE